MSTTFAFLAVLLILPLTIIWNCNIGYGALMPTPAEAGTNLRNYNDGLCAAKAFCHSVDGVA